MRTIELWMDNGEGVWGFFMEGGACVYAHDYSNHIDSEYFLNDVLAFMDGPTTIDEWWGNDLDEFPTIYDEVTDNGRRIL